jgi:hypothetical protein
MSTAAEAEGVGFHGDDHDHQSFVQQGTADRPKTPVDAEGCLDHSCPAPAGGRKPDLAMFNLAIDSNAGMASRTSRRGSTRIVTSQTLWGEIPNYFPQ